MNNYRQVTWNFPKLMYERLEKAKAEGQKSSGIPPNASDESFALFLLDRALALYEAQLSSEKLIVDPGAGLVTYRGTRTPR